MKYFRIIVLSSVLTILTACSSKSSLPGETVVAQVPIQQTRQTSHLLPKVIVRTNASEIQILARLARALDELEALIREAEISADPDARVRFDYYQLRADLLSISQGIQAHIDTPVYMPRVLDPIVGNYGR